MTTPDRMSVSPTAKAGIGLKFINELLHGGDHAIGADLRRTKEHVVRAAQLQRSEIKIEGRFQLLAIPCVSTKELFVVSPLLVPIRKKRTGEIEALPIPALRDHV